MSCSSVCKQPAASSGPEVEPLWSEVEKVLDLGVASSWLMHMCMCVSVS